MYKHINKALNKIRIIFGGNVYSTIITHFCLKRAWHKPLPYRTKKSRTCQLHPHDLYEIIIKIIIIKCKSLPHELTNVF